VDRIDPQPQKLGFILTELTLKKVIPAEIHQSTRERAAFHL
jgi:hypothetical protein